MHARKLLQTLTLGMKPKYNLGRATLAQRSANAERESMYGNWISAERFGRLYPVFFVYSNAHTQNSVRALSRSLEHKFDTCVGQMQL